MGRRSKAQVKVSPGLCSLTVWILACSFVCMGERTTLTQRLLSIFQKGSEVSSAPPARWLGGLEVLTVEVLITVATFKVWSYDLGWSGPHISGRCCGSYSLTGAIPKQLTSQSSWRRPFCALTGDPGYIWLPWNTCSFENFSDVGSLTVSWLYSCTQNLSQPLPLWWSSACQDSNVQWLPRPRAGPEGLTLNVSNLCAS